jgi:cytoskeletal protein CcmA (bactofilin family)
MIRMGRSSRTEPSDTTPYQGTAQSSGIGYQYAEESNQAQPRIVAESESIARDIKEGRLSGFVGHGTTLTGETNFQMMLRVDGHLTGTVTSDGGTLIVGSTGQVDANVAVAVANINGTVNGDVIATERIQLGRTARVIGNIATPKLVIDDGAIFEGGCNMIKAVENKERQAAADVEQTRAYEASRYQQATAAAEDEDEIFEVAEEDETAEVAVV